MKRSPETSGVFNRALRAGSMAAILLLAACSSSHGDSTSAPTGLAPGASKPAPIEVTQYALTLERQLNTDGFVPEVTIERGYQVKVIDPAQPNIDGAVSPLRLGKGWFGYIQTQGENYDEITVIPTDAKLQPATFGKDYKNPHEVKDSIAVINTVSHRKWTPNDPPIGTPLFTAIYAGQTPGTMDEHIHVDPSLTGTAYNIEVSRQEIAISQDIVAGVFGDADGIDGK